MVKEGFDPEVLRLAERPSQRFFASVTNLMTGALIGLLALHTLGVKNVPGFYYFAEFPDQIAALIGLVIGLFGLSICFIAQKAMGAAWRVGIDREAATELVDRGLFAYCRNPTYLGLFLVCIATLWIFPTMAFLLWVVLFLFMLEFQVRLEEEHLLERHGEVYRDYSRRVKRYIPGVY